MGVLSALTTSGWRKLGQSFAKNEAAERSVVKALGREVGVMGTAAAALASPVLVPLNLLAHGGALAVKGYRGAWRRMPGLTTLGTAAVAVPTAMLVMGRTKHHDHSSAQAMEDIGAQQAQTAQVQTTLGQMEAAAAAPAATAYSSFQEASPRIDPATASLQNGRAAQAEPNAPAIGG